MNTRKVMGALGALVLAGLGTLALVAYVNGAEERATAGEERVEVLLISDRVPPGTEAAELERYVESTMIPAKLRTDDSVTEITDLEGLVASVELLPGEMVRTSRFSSPEIFESDQLRQSDVPPGMQEITVSLAPERAVGGLVVPGHTVGIYASFEPFAVSSEVPVEVDGFIIPPNGDTPSTTKALVHQVLVTNVQLEKLPEVTERVGLGDETDEEIRLAPTGKLLVTFAVDTATAERIVFSLEFGRIWLTLEPVDVLTEPSQVWTRAEIYEALGVEPNIQVVGG